MLVAGSRQGAGRVSAAEGLNCGFSNITQLVRRNYHGLCMKISFSTHPPTQCFFGIQKNDHAHVRCVHNCCSGRRYFVCFLIHQIRNSHAYAELGLLGEGTQFVPFVQDLCGNLGPQAAAFLGQLQDCRLSKSNFKLQVKKALSASLVANLSRSADAFNRGLLDGTPLGVG